MEIKSSFEDTYNQIVKATTNNTTVAPANTTSSASVQRPVVQRKNTVNTTYTTVPPVNSTSSTSFDASSAASSSYGDLELTKYLYESGLQNIFNTYQQNIATLNQEEQQNIQDAYYVREMSKKYLGEYASNTGIGDVSGNLLDIYSKYQQNIDEIKKEYNTLSLDLQKEYQKERFDSVSNILMTQYGIEVAKKDEVYNQVLSDIMYGDVGDKYEYLKSKESLLSSDDYLALFNSLKKQDAIELSEEITQRLSSGMYGYDDSGKLITDPLVMLEQYKDDLPEEEYNKLYSFYKESIDRTNAVTDMLGFKDVTSSKTYDESGTLVDNPDYVGDDYDVSLNTRLDPNVDATSLGLQDSQGNRFFTSTKSVDEENMGMTSENLFSEYDSRYAATDDDGNKLYPDMEQSPEVGYILSDVRTTKDGKTTTTDYYYDGKEWKRLVKEDPFTDSEMSTWFIPSGAEEYNVSDEVRLDKNQLFNFFDWGGKHFISIKDNLYFSDQSISITDEVKDKVLEKFIKIHGNGNADNIHNNSVVLYNNKFYYYIDGKITEMVKG